MKQIYILLVFNFLILNLFGQSPAYDCNDSAVVTSFEAKATAYFIPTETHLREKCYTDRWRQATILMYNNEIVRGNYVQYNGFNDTFLGLSQPDLRQVCFCREMIKEVSIGLSEGKDSLHFKQMKIKAELSTDSINVFLNVLYEGKLSLYAFRKYIEQIDSQNFSPSFEFYLKKQDGLLHKIKLSRHSFLSQYPDKKKQLRKLIRANSLDLSEEKDMIKLLQLFGQNI